MDEKNLGDIANASSIYLNKHRAVLLHGPYRE